MVIGVGMEIRLGFGERRGLRESMVLGHMYIGFELLLNLKLSMRSYGFHFCS